MFKITYLLIFLLIILIFFYSRESFYIGKIFNAPVNLEDEGKLEMKNKIKNNKITLSKLIFAESSNNNEQYIDYIRAKFIKNIPLLFKEKLCLGETCLVENDFLNLKKSFPQGTIIPWVPPEAEEGEEQVLEAPSGWVICDGRNTPDGKGRTPNLSNLFIKGKTLNGGVISGGNNSFKLATKNLPEHSHGINIPSPGKNCFGPSIPENQPYPPNYDDTNKCPYGSPYTQKRASGGNMGVPNPRANGPKYPDNYNLSYMYINSSGPGDNYPLGSSLEGGEALPNQPADEEIKCDTVDIDNTPVNIKLVYIMKVNHDLRGTCYMSGCNKKKHYKSKCNKSLDKVVTYTNPSKGDNKWTKNNLIKQNCKKQPTFPEGSNTACASVPKGSKNWNARNTKSGTVVRTVCRANKEK